MAQFEFAPQVEAVAQQVIEGVEEHRHLRRARIAYLFRVAESWDARAKVYRVPPMYRLLSGYDLAVVVWHTGWALLSEAERRAMLDHEFCHVAPDEEGGWRLRHHDLEEFAAVVERHGLWDLAVKRVAEAAKPYLKQQIFEEMLAPTGPEEGR